jgi:GTP-binding protein
MADIPGLIEGAHQGAGLGHEFLRHVERAGILVHMVEPEPLDATDPLENYQSIHHELVQYNETLAGRPQLVAVSKAELPSAGEIQQRLQEFIDSPVLLISAVTGEGLNVLTSRIVQLLDQLAKAPKERAGR